MINENERMRTPLQNKLAPNNEKSAKQFNGPYKSATRSKTNTNLKSSTFCGNDLKNTLGSQDPSGLTMNDFKKEVKKGFFDIKPNTNKAKTNIIPQTLKIHNKGIEILNNDSDNLNNMFSKTHFQISNINQMTNQDIFDKFNQMPDDQKTPNQNKYGENSYALRTGSKTPNQRTKTPNVRPSSKMLDDEDQHHFTPLLSKNSLRIAEGLERPMDRLLKNKTPKNEILTEMKQELTFTPKINNRSKNIDKKVNPH